MSDKNTRLSRSPQVLIVEASAGSGKTYCLAKRYVSLLINPYLKPEEIPLNTILAITFTNKAAFEMKERILDFLKRIALDKFENSQEKEDVLSSLGVSEELARKKAYIIMNHLIRNYNFFQVQTIDSFINAILYGCAFRLELSASFKTEKYYRDYLAYSLDRLIDRAGYDKEVLRLFHGFLRQYLFIENRTGWFPKENILALITALFSEGNKYSGTFIRNNIEIKDLICQRKEILKQMQQIRDKLPAGTHKGFVNRLENFLEENRESLELDKIPAFFERDVFPVTKGNYAPPEVARLWNRIRENIRELCEIESTAIFNYYVDILDKVSGELKNLSRREDVLFLEALNRETRRLFDEKSLGLPELYYRLAARFRHFLIDEFQDTSKLQWENLFAMVEDALSNAGSLFYVGDKKQAIYRFRGGEVSLFDEVKNYFRTCNFHSESLKKNYRSQKAVVEFNNSVFSEENLKRFLEARETRHKNGIKFSSQDTDRIIDAFRHSKQDYKGEKNGGYVKVEFLDCRDRQERDDILRERMLLLIKNLRNRFFLKEIALLARKNSEVELFTSWLLEENIPVESEKTLNIRENPYVKELVSFLRFLSSPIDNLSFASFILGDIFSGVSGINSEELQEFIFKINNSGKETAYLYREFRKKYPLAWEELIEEFFKNVGFIPLYELVIAILSKFNVFGNFPDYQGFFMKFLELLRAQEEKYSGISAFLEFFEKAAEEELYVNVTQSDAIKILTIHKSKGLGFPVVAIPCLEMEVKTDKQLVVPDNGELRLIYIKRRYADYSPRLAGLLKEQYKRSFVDELNSIYVAFTRAEDELYIFVSPKAERGINLASLLLPENNLERGRPSGNKKENTEKVYAIELPSSKYKDWIHILKDEFVEEAILESRERIKRGELLHAILSFIGNLYGRDKNLILREAIEKARAKFPYIEDFGEFEMALGKLLGDKKFQPYFEIEDGQVFLEKEVVNSCGNTKRIDRLVVKQDEVWVLDYKSTKENRSEYQAQVLEYMKIMQDIYPKSKVSGVLIYLDDLSIEEIK